VTKTIIISMAGRGSRFRDQGYTCPKYEILFKNKTLFEWSLISLRSLFREHFIFVTLTENNSADFIKTKCKSLGINNFSIMELSAVTNGQATTVLEGLTLAKSEGSVVIFNIDTHIDPLYIEECIDFSKPALIPCFRAAGDHWSFAKTNANGIAVEVAEKKRISDLASIGLYVFPSKEAYQKAYENHRHTNDLKELYVAPLFNYLIEQHQQVIVPELPFESVYTMGTPKELSQLEAQVKNYNPFVKLSRPNDKMISVVIQGPVARSLDPKSTESLTATVSKSIRKILPKAEIILSTWENQDLSGIIFDKLMINQDPGAEVFDTRGKTFNNCNRQIASTIHGIRSASRPYVLKLRSDLILCSPRFLKYFDAFPLREQQWSFFKSRVLAFSVFSRRYGGCIPYEQLTPFHPSDFIYFGRRTDLIELFDIPLMPAHELGGYFNSEHSTSSFDWQPHHTWRYPPEQHIWYEFIKKHIPSLKWLHKLHVNQDLQKISDKTIINNLIMLDQYQWDVKAPKFRLKQHLLSPQDWEGLFTHQVWKKIYSQNFSLFPWQLPTYDTLARWIFSTLGLRILKNMIPRSIYLKLLGNLRKN